MRVDLLRHTISLASMVAAGAACAQSGADFFSGKTVNYIVATAPGGGYDTYGRLVAEYMQKNLPGSTFIVRNMPGAGHLVGTNAIYASKPDGLTIGTFNTGLLYNQLMNYSGVKFDLTKMSWIGKAASDPRIFIVTPQSKIANWTDFIRSKDPVNFATAGVGAAAYVETMMLTRALKLPIRIQTGYNGTEDMQAMRRGEIHGAIASRSSYEGFVANGYGRFIAQIGGKDKDLPQVITLTDDPNAKRLVALVQSQGDISRLTAGPPDIPADRLESLRAAYRKAMEDREAQQKAEKLGRPLEPAYGDDVLAQIKTALAQSPETIALLKETMKDQK
ncbi:MAG: Bug family tripartite tricarboxylate transporter substrate binding protein [Beijerinckiaceae bacterium]